MKKFKKVFTVAAVITTMAATVLAGCAKKFNAKTYVEGTLDVCFKNEISNQYIKLVDGDKETIQKGYANQIEMLVDELKVENVADELINQYRDMYIDLFSKCKYTVGEVTEDKSTNNFIVTVTIEPLDINMEEILTATFAHIDQLPEAQNQMIDGELPADSVEQIFSFMLPMFQDALVTPKYLEAQIFEVHVNKVENNYYDIPKEDMETVISAATGLGA